VRGGVQLSDAYFAVLLETDGDDTLILTAQAGLEFPAPTFTATEQRSWAMLAYAARTAMYIDDPAGIQTLAVVHAADRPAAIHFETKRGTTSHPTGYRAAVVVVFDRGGPNGSAKTGDETKRRSRRCRAATTGTEKEPDRRLVGTLSQPQDPAVVHV
jgi:hypothetical protein